MSQSFNQKPIPAETDIAFELLQVHGKPIYYLKLIEGILERMNLSQDAKQISSVLTQINLDTRFAYVGQGEWGLKTWVPTKGSKRLPNISLMNKTVAYDDDDDVIRKKVSLQGDDEDLDNDFDSDYADELEIEDDDVADNEKEEDNDNY